MRVRPVAEQKSYEAWAFADFDAGSDAMRRVVQAGLRPTVLRLSDEAETMVNLASQTAIGAEAVAGCLLVVGFEGVEVAGVREAVAAVLAEAGRLRFALDVTDPEPLPDGHPLWSAPDVLITPHVAGGTTAMLPRIAALVRSQAERLVAGQEPQHVVHRS